VPNPPSAVPIVEIVNQPIPRTRAERCLGRRRGGTACLAARRDRQEEERNPAAVFGRPGRS